MNTYSKREIDALYDVLRQRQEAVAESEAQLEPILARAKSMADFMVEHTTFDDYSTYVYRPSQHSGCYTESLEPYDGKQFVFGLQTYRGEGNYDWLNERGKYDTPQGFVVPVEWLAMDDREWQQIVLDREAARLQAIADAKAAKERAAAELQEKHEREEYERLRTKYELEKE